MMNDKSMWVFWSLNIILCCDCNRRSDTSPTVTTAVWFVLGRHLRNHIIHVTIKNYCPLCYYLIMRHSLLLFRPLGLLHSWMANLFWASLTDRESPLLRESNTKHRYYDEKLLRLWMWIQTNTHHYTLL